MPILTFIDAKPTNQEKDGLEVLFHYNIDNAPESQTIHVLGSQDSWGLKDQEKADYIKLLFTGTIAYIKNHWETYEELPANDKQINSETDFPPYQKVQTDWEGYTLDISR